MESPPALSAIKRERVSVFSHDCGGCGLRWGSLGFGAKLHHFLTMKPQHVTKAMSLCPHLQSELSGAHAQCCGRLVPGVWIV